MTIVRVARALCIVVSILLLEACGPQRDDVVDNGDVATSDAARNDASIVETPYLQTPFERVYRPRGTRYLNDHTLALGSDGWWHVYGITHESEGTPHAERSFLHARARRLEGPWEELADALVAEPDEAVLWAPHVFERSPDQWTMLFWAGSRLKRADSVDLMTWRRTAHRLVGKRDPFVLRDNGRWWVYYVETGPRNHGQIAVTSSVDLEQWSDPTVVIEDPVPSFPWGNLESPAVVAKSGGYYLFLTRTGVGHETYDREVVFFSTDLTRFTWAPIAEMRAHAAEVFVHEGQWYMTSCGWTSHVGENRRGLSLARLGWR